MFLTAHSGCSGTEMNSAQYLKKAVTEPVDFIEFDVRRDRSGELILQHNEIAGAGASTGSCPGLTLRDALLLILEEEQCASGSGEKRLNCDLKEYGLAPEVQDTARECGMDPDRVWFSGSMKPAPAEVPGSPISGREAGALTFDVPAGRILINAEELVPGIYRNHSAEDKIRQVRTLISRFKRTSCPALNIDYHFCTDDVVREFIRAKVPLSLWTIDDAETLRHYRALLPGPLLVNVTTRQPEIIR